MPSIYSEISLITAGFTNYVLKFYDETFVVPKPLRYIVI